MTVTGKPLLLRPLAQADIDAIIAYCRTEGGASLAGQFVNELEDALRTLAKHLAIGSRRYADLLGIPGLRGLARTYGDSLLHGALRRAWIE